MTGGGEYLCAEEQHRMEESLRWVIADLRQKLQDERDGAEEALKAKDEVIAELQLRCSALENLLDKCIL